MSYTAFVEKVVWLEGSFGSEKILKIITIKGNIRIVNFLFLLSPSMPPFPSHRRQPVNDI
jgi:hypothetical protein